MSGYDKMIFAKNLCRCITMENLNQKDVAKFMCVSESTVSSWCDGSKMPRMDKVQRLADKFGVLKSDLIEEKESIFDLPGVIPMPKMRKVPRLGTIACGEPILAEENIETYDSVPESVRCDFSLICKGDSMINARIFSGDVVYLCAQPTVENGEIAAVMVDEDEATLKRVMLYEDHISLEPENPMYKPIVLWGDDMNSVKILGKAVYFTSAVR